MHRTSFHAIFTWILTFSSPSFFSLTVVVLSASEDVLWRELDYQLQQHTKRCVSNSQLFIYTAHHLLLLLNLFFSLWVWFQIKDMGVSCTFLALFLNACSILIVSSALQDSWAAWWAFATWGIWVERMKARVELEQTAARLLQYLMPKDDSCLPKLASSEWLGIWEPCYFIVGLFCCSEGRVVAIKRLSRDEFQLTNAVRREVMQIR